MQDAYKLMPWADYLYGCDAKWWHLHKDCDGFAGEKFSTHDEANNKKLDVAEQYGLSLVMGAHSNTFSRDPGLIHYGSNSGFQAINLAILLGATYIVLVGFNMKHAGGKAHFFGNHPHGLYQNPDYSRFVRDFEVAAKKLDGVRIVNATPDTALTCFEQVELEAALAAVQRDHLLHRDRPVADAGADRGCAA